MVRSFQRKYRAIKRTEELLHKGKYIAVESLVSVNVEPRVQHGDKDCTNINCIREWLPMKLYFWFLKYTANYILQLNVKYVVLSTLLILFKFCFNI